MRTNLEFIPWTAVPNLRAAAEVIRAVDHPSTGIVIDSLHFERSGSRPEEISRLPAEWFRYMQLCDGPAENPSSTAELIDQARNSRQIPGRGSIDILAPIRHLPRDLPMALEVPLRTPSPVPADVRAGDVLAGARRMLPQMNIQSLRGASGPDTEQNTEE
jgi:sugar phosphate isomerase/epimerase